MSALNRNRNGPQWGYVTTALLVFVMNMFSVQPGSYSVRFAKPP